MVIWAWVKYVAFLYWVKLLGWPIDVFSRTTGIRLPVLAAVLIKAVLTLLLLYLVYSMLDRMRKSLRRLIHGGREALYDRADLEALRSRDAAMQKDQSFTQVLDAAQHLEATLEPLRRRKDYAAMAAVYASLNRHREAARFYQKAGKRREAATALARDGQTLKAAKLLMKEGDFETAARFFAEGGKPLAAAKAHAQGGKLADAAAGYVAAGKPREAANAYAEYFAKTRDDDTLQVAAAEACLNLLRDPAAAPRIPAEVRPVLLAEVAARLERGKRYDLAAALYRETGNAGRAGEVYLLAGNLQEAAACMTQAGRAQEAAQCLARHKEALGQWRDAGMAYVQAGDMMRAAECYTKAGEAVRAAECFEKARDFYRAGLGYARAGRFQEAIRVVQNVREGEPMFDASRAMLGRCFFELHDYAHCAAALENHLTGKRVASDNVELHYMLALAYEQLGKLSQARELLYKIRTVDISFRDVEQRITHISSVISRQSAAAVGPGQTGVPTAAAVLSGTSIEGALGERYQIVRELGRGGMGVVYLARDTQLDRPVALKFLGSLIDSSEEYRQRFIREAQTAARISHPNIVAIYDISASTGRAYIAMEYVEGTSLYKHIRAAGRLAPREAVLIVGNACAALAALHAAGIVHRDIKPDNILLGKNGIVKLSDFGLAKAEDARMTRTGLIMGTPSYMSPEQVRGRDADARSDIYSLGLVLYECLSGDTVFRGEDVLDRQIEEVPPPPSQATKDVSPALDQVVMKCIAKEPAQRYADARELLAALRALVT